MKFTVSFREVLERNIEIEAETKEEAYDIAKEMYDREEVVLDSSDLSEQDIVVE